MHSPLRLPRIMVTNDDGFDAPGLAALAEAAQDFAHEVWVIAPDRDQSGSGQSMSLHHPLRCWPKGDRRWEISGTPADCVAVALSHLMAKTKPSLILSGINSGANIGDDVNLSGTLGAAFAGLLLGVPSIAFSQDYTTRQNVRWDTARAIVPKLLTHFLAKGWRKDTCLSVNIPDRPAAEISGFTWTRQASRTTAGVTIERREDLREKSYFWINLYDHDKPGKDENTDDAVLRRGEVTVTPLGLDRSFEVSSPPVIFDAPASVDG